MGRLANRSGRGNDVFSMPCMINKKQIEETHECKTRTPSIACPLPGSGPTSSRSLAASQIKKDGVVPYVRAHRSISQCNVRSSACDMNTIPSIIGLGSDPSAAGVGSAGPPCHAPMHDAAYSSGTEPRRPSLARKRHQDDPRAANQAAPHVARTSVSKSRSSPAYLAMGDA